MKVVHVVRQFHPSVGGLEDGVLSLARTQRARGICASSVVTLDRAFTDRATRLAPADAVEGVPVRRLPWRGSTRYPLAPSVLRAIAGADLVHVHAIDFFFDFLAATRPLHGRTLVASTHGGFFHTGAGRLKRAYFATVTRASVRAYAAIVACSANDAAIFAPIAADRMTTIENGVDFGRYARAASASPNRRIICFGRLASHKRIDRLFLLLAELRRRSPEWSLVVAGSPGDQPLETLRRMARAAGVAEAVQFELSPETDRLRSLIGSCAWFASASEHEGFGLAAVEALAAGLFPILSDIPPFAALTRRTGLGMLFNPADPEPAAARIEGAFASWKAPSDDVLARAVAPYDWGGVALRYSEVYERVLAGSHALVPA